MRRKKGKESKKIEKEKGSRRQLEQALIRYI